MLHIRLGNVLIKSVIAFVAPFKKELTPNWKAKRSSDWYLFDWILGLLCVIKLVDEPIFVEVDLSPNRFCGFTKVEAISVPLTISDESSILVCVYLVCQE